MLLETLRTMKNGEKPIANPYVLLREEFDDWAILFNPDTGHGFGLNPAGVYVWKLLDGEHTTEALLKGIRAQAEGVPEEAGDHIGAFIDALVREGLAGFGRSRLGLPDEAGSAQKSSSPDTAVPWSETNQFTYEAPQLVDFACGSCSPPTCVGGTSNTTCSNGCQANGTWNNGGGCNTGTLDTYYCSCGISPGYWCADGGSASANVQSYCYSTGCSPMH